NRLEHSRDRMRVRFVNQELASFLLDFSKCVELRVHQLGRRSIRYRQPLQPFFSMLERYTVWSGVWTPRPRYRAFSLSCARTRSALTFVYTSATQLPKSSDILEHRMHRTTCAVALR